MTTVPVPVKVNVAPPNAAVGPKTNLMAPLEATAVIDTCVPTRAGRLDCVTEPERVTVVPSVEPVSGN